MFVPTNDKTFPCQAFSKLSYFQHVGVFGGFFKQATLFPVLIFVFYLISLSKKEIDGV